MIVTTRRERVGVALILVASFLLFNLYNALTPLFEASDELWHYPLVQYLATGHGLPIQYKDETDADAPWRQEASQPPLYYFIAALVTTPIDTSNWREVHRINPHADNGVPTRDGNQNAILHTHAEAFPWTRAALAVHVARLLSTLLSTLTVFFAYLIARELFPHSLSLRLGTMLFTAFVPMFAFISGSVNNDNAAVLFATIGVWWALRSLRVGDLSARGALIAGVIAGLGALSKSSALGLVGLFGLSALLTFARVRPRDKSALIRLIVYAALVVIAVVVITGWWFVRNQQLYGDWLGWNAFLDVVGRRVPPATLTQLWSEREGFVWAYWGVFGTLNVIMPHGVYDLLNVIALLALIGCVWALLRTRLHIASLAFPQLTLCVFWVALIFVSLLRWTALTPASQGRLMLPCIAVIAAGLAFGLAQLHRVLMWVGAALFASVAVFVPFALIAPTYAQPSPLRTAQPAHAINAVFANAIELIGSDEPSANAQPGQAVTLRLYWRMRASVERNFSVFVHLLDDNDVVIAQRDMYPGQGSLATSELATDFAWSDFYTLRIPRRGTLPPQHVRWEVGVYDVETGKRLTSNQTTDALRFGSLALARDENDHTPLLDYTNGMQLLSYDLAPRTLHAGELLTVTLQWRAARQVNADYKVSVQLLDDEDHKIAQHDATPANGDAPTSTWLRGAVIADVHPLQLAPAAPHKVYRVLIICYLPEDSSRLSAYDEHGQFVGDQIELTRIRIQ